MNKELTLAALCLMLNIASVSAQYITDQSKKYLNSFLETFILSEQSYLEEKSKDPRLLIDWLKTIKDNCIQENGSLKLNFPETTEDIELDDPNLYNPAFDQSQWLYTDWTNRADPNKRPTYLESTHSLQKKTYTHKNHIYTRYLTVDKHTTDMRNNILNNIIIRWVYENRSARITYIDEYNMRNINKKDTSRVREVANAHFERYENDILTKYQGMTWGDGGQHSSFISTSLKCLLDLNKIDDHIKELEKKSPYRLTQFLTLFAIRFQKPLAFSVLIYLGKILKKQINQRG